MPVCGFLRSFFVFFVNIYNSSDSLLAGVETDLTDMLSTGRLSPFMLPPSSFFLLYMKLASTFLVEMRFVCCLYVNCEKCRHV